MASKSAFLLIPFPTASNNAIAAAIMMVCVCVVACDSDRRTAGAGVTAGSQLFHAVAACHT